MAIFSRSIQWKWEWDLSGICSSQLQGEEAERDTVGNSKRSIHNSSMIKNVNFVTLRTLHCDLDVNGVTSSWPMSCTAVGSTEPYPYNVPLDRLDICQLHLNSLQICTALTLGIIRLALSW